MFAVPMLFGPMLVIVIVYVDGKPAYIVRGLISAVKNLSAALADGAIILNVEIVTNAIRIIAVIFLQVFTEVISFLTFTYFYLVYGSSRLILIRFFTIYDICKIAKYMIHKNRTQCLGISRLCLNPFFKSTFEDSYFKLKLERETLSISQPKQKM